MCEGDDVEGANCNCNQPYLFAKRAPCEDFFLWRLSKVDSNKELDEIKATWLTNNTTQVQCERVCLTQVQLWTVTLGC